MLEINSFVSIDEGCRRGTFNIFNVRWNCWSLFYWTDRANQTRRNEKNERNGVQENEDVTENALTLTVTMFVGLKRYRRSKE